MTKVRFVTMGRLVTQKGTHHIVKLCKVLHDMALDDKVEITIFGDGPLKNEVQEAAKKYGFLIYRGHQPKDEVFRVIQNSQYAFMLSSFLETFWLAALDAVALGVPVIGFKKAGVEPFIDQGLQIHDGSDEEVFQQLVTLVTRLVTEFSPVMREQQKAKTLDIAENFTPGHRIEQLKELTQWSNIKKILLVSDYVVDIGGIESYLLQVYQLLQEQGYEVRLLGNTRKPNHKQLFLNLFVTAFNRTFARRIARQHATFQPDLIRRNSVHRRIGPLPLRLLRKSKAIQWVMYHDRWLFHPFPSEVTSFSQLFHTNTLWGFLKEAMRRPLKGLLALPKRCSLVMIKLLLSRNCSLHLVPSHSMEPIITRHYEPSHVIVQTFPHFVRPT